MIINAPFVSNRGLSWIGILHMLRTCDQSVMALIGGLTVAPRLCG